VPLLCYTIIASCTFSALFAYISIAPFFFINELGVSVEGYGYHQITVLIFYMIGTFVSKYLVSSLGVGRFLGYGLVVSLLSGLCFIGATAFWGRTSYIITGTMALYCFGGGLILAHSSAQAMAIFPRTGGASAALLSTMEMFFLRQWLFS